MTSARTIVAASIAVFALTACGPAATTASSSGSAAPASPLAAGSTPASCPNGRLANGDCAGGTSAPPRLAGDTMAPVVCPKILQVQETRAIYDDPDAMRALGEQAATSLDFNLAFAGQMLADQAELAKAAKGADDELAMSLHMGAAAVDLATVCIKAGYKK